MVRDVYPHDRFPDGPYERCTSDVISKGNKGADNKAMISEGIKKLKKANKLQMIGFYTFLVAMIGVVIFIASTQK